MQSLPGFRDYPPDLMARRNYLFDIWRAVATRYGFEEYDGPVLEPTDLYRKKSGGELLGQLFTFTDRGEREVTLRPEMTPTMARMVAERAGGLRKPIKWFTICRCFRYEKPQKGRFREFFQFNADLIGNPSPAADAELIALTIDLLRAFGLGPEDFRVRIGDRDAWSPLLRRKEIPPERTPEFLAVVDKLERDRPETLQANLAPFGLDLEEVRAFLASGEGRSAKLDAILQELEGRGLGPYAQIDLRVVRGLAYYTGAVFEAFDVGRGFRAIAGGGRFDGLFALLSDRAADLPAVGVGIGDAVLSDLIEAVPAAQTKRADWLARKRGGGVYVVVASEPRRGDALGLVQRLRDAGYRAEFGLDPAKVGKQFQTAAQLGMAWAVVVGDEWPRLALKNLSTREERQVDPAELEAALAAARQTP